MKGGISIARRQFLRIAGFTLAASGLGRLGSLLLTQEEPTLERNLGGHILGLVRYPESVRAVGEEYLRRRPQEADVELLVSSLVASEDTRGLRGMPIDKTALSSAFQVAHRLDFEKSRLVVIGGWYLTRSEAQMCALAHLLRGA